MWRAHVRVCLLCVCLCRRDSEENCSSSFSNVGFLLERDAQSPDRRKVMMSLRWVRSEVAQETRRVAFTRVESPADQSVVKYPTINDRNVERSDGF